MPEISNPHDHFFKQVFSRKEVAVDFLRNYLPADVLACIDEESVILTNDSFVDSNLRSHLSDLLYEVKLSDGSDAYVYVLFEHKSFPYAGVAFQLLRYMVRIWEQSIEQKQAEKFPPVIPLVLYHGVTRWETSCNFSSLVAHHEALQDFVPDFRYLICDLSRYSNDDIKGMVLLKVAMLLLKHIMSDDLRGQLPGIFKLLKDLSFSESGMEYLRTILIYLSNSTKKITGKEIRDALEKTFPPDGGNIMPTIAEEWIREGFEKGMRQGMQQGMQQGLQQGMQQGIHQGMLQTARDNVLEILEIRFEAVPQSVMKRLKEINDPDILKMLHKKSLRADSMDGFRKIMDMILE